ncbi:MAG: pacearchaeosortase [Nanoarchaeota archaeon]|nr:pacearchaeosortase [Nanoarchaeota archaeon]
MKKKVKKNKKLTREDRKILRIPLRYLILLAIMFSLPLIYKIITPLTIYPVFYILKLFYSNVSSLNDLIIINLKTYVKIIPACVAGSAYLLLLILNLTLPMGIMKRIYFILLSFLMLLIINIIRIVLFIILYHNDFTYFDLTHKFFWYFLSTLFVVMIWFVSVKIFKVKDIPFYSDAKVLIRSIKKKK